MWNRMNAVTLTLLLAGLAALPAPSLAGDTFIESDDYKEGEEIVGKFLKDDAYRKMAEEITRNGEEFDWGWVKAQGKPAKPKQLGFDFASYKTVAIPEVQNFAGIASGGELPGKVREAFVLAMKELGLEVAKEGQAADLELGLAIVDAKRDSTFIYFGNIQPFIEVELRLRVVSSGEDLVLLRNQSHSDDLENAAMRYADTLVKFLR
jgi:hypothetical protein